MSRIRQFTIEADDLVGDVSADRITGVVATENGGLGDSYSSAGAIKSALGIVSAAAVQAFSSGTPFTVVASSTAVVFGASSPAITLTAPGNYLLLARAQTRLSAASFQNSQPFNIRFRRTNNTAGNLGAGSGVVSGLTGVTSVESRVLLDQTWFIPYTTFLSDDQITLFADVSANASAGALKITAAGITAFRLQ